MTGKSKPHATIPGNHDYYGPKGKHQSTRFCESASQTVLVTSDPDVADIEADTAVLTTKMYCPGAPEGLLPMTDFGLTRNSRYLHWETPFGDDDALESREYEASSADGNTVYALTDASYLVEPVPGLWLLMLDANVFEPRNGQWEISQKKAFIDSSDAGWSSVIRNKPYLLDWIKSVCQRANEHSKSLLAFSHYPAITTCSDPLNVHEKLFGDNEYSRRQPNKEVANQLSQLGLKIHFGGHMHVAGIQSVAVKGATLTNIAVPSPVAYPPGYAMLEAVSDQCKVDIISLDKLQTSKQLMDFYRQEVKASGAQDDAALNTNNYGEFLYLRQYSRVIDKHLKKDWPKAIAAAVRQSSTADLLYLFIMQTNASQPAVLGEFTDVDQELNRATCVELLQKHQLDMDTLTACSMIDLIVDWYCLRDGNAAAKSYIDTRRLRIYRFLSAQFGNEALTTINNDADYFTALLGLMKNFLNELALSTNSTVLPLAPEQ